MSSRASKKRKAGGLGPKSNAGQAGPPAESASAFESFLKYFFGIIAGAGVGVWGAFTFFESWRLAVACAVVTAAIAVIAIRRGEELF